MAAVKQSRRERTERFLHRGDAILFDRVGHESSQPLARVIRNLRQMKYVTRSRGAKPRLAFTSSAHDYLLYRDGSSRPWKELSPIHQNRLLKHAVISMLVMLGEMGSSKRMPPYSTTLVDRLVAGLEEKCTFERSFVDVLSKQLDRVRNTERIEWLEKRANHLNNAISIYKGIIRRLRSGEYRW